MIVNNLILIIYYKAKMVKVKAKARPTFEDFDYPKRLDLLMKDPSHNKVEIRKIRNRIYAKASRIRSHQKTVQNEKNYCLQIRSLEETIQSQKEEIFALKEQIADLKHKVRASKGENYELKRMVFLRPTTTYQTFTV